MGGAWGCHAYNRSTNFGQVLAGWVLFSNLYEEEMHSTAGRRGIGVGEQPSRRNFPSAPVDPARCKIRGSYNVFSYIPSQPRIRACPSVFHSSRNILRRFHTPGGGR